MVALLAIVGSVFYVWHNSQTEKRQKEKMDAMQDKFDRIEAESQVLMQREQSRRKSMQDFQHHRQNIQAQDEALMQAASQYGVARNNMVFDGQANQAPDPGWHQIGANPSNMEPNKSQRPEFNAEEYAQARQAQIPNLRQSMEGAASFHDA